MRKLGRALLVAGVSALIAGGAPAQHISPAPAMAPAKPQPTAPRRNVLLIISDDLNTRLGAYGASTPTPNIDRFARQGVRFERAYAQFPWCGPSRASFLSGLRPSTVNVLDLQTPLRNAIPNLITLPQYFKANGYYSGRVGKVFHQSVPEDIGTSGPDDVPSWTEVVNPRGHDKDVEDRLVNFTPGIGLGSAQSLYADSGPDEDQTDGKIATETIRMLEQHGSQPFFIAAGFYRPHVPEVAPKKYFDRCPLSKIKLANETPQTLAAILPATRAWLPDNFGMTPSEQRRMIQAYCASTAFMDAQVGRVLQALTRLRLDDKTIVVFVSDHGFLLGEHGQWMKNELWEEADHVPLIIRAPGAAGNGKPSPQLVELLDLYPTLVQAAGLPANPANQGKSLLPLLRQPADPSWAKPAYSQIRGGRSVRTARFRYTEWEGGKLGRELYDLVADPLSHRNLATDPKYAGTIQQLHALLPVETVERRPNALRYSRTGKCLEVPAQIKADVGARCAVAQDP